MIKKIILFLTIIVIASYPQSETLLKGEAHNGGFGSFTTLYSKIKNEDALLLGGRGAWLINHQFALGLSANFLVSKISVNLLDYLYDPHYSFTYGGLTLGYFINPDKLVNIYISSLFGAGYFSYNENKYLVFLLSQNAVPLVIEPSIEAMVNVTSFLRISAGASYRFVSNFGVKNFNSSDLRNFNLIFGLNFGSF